MLIKKIYRLITDDEMRQLFVQDCKVAAGKFIFISLHFFWDAQTDGLHLLAEIGADGRGKHSWANSQQQQQQQDQDTPESAASSFAPLPGPSTGAGTSALPEPKRRFKADSITEMAPNLFHKNFDRKLLPGRTIHTADEDISE